MVNVARRVPDGIGCVLTQVPNRLWSGIANRMVRLGFVRIYDAHARLKGIMRDH